jgi:hypothetical protein
MLISTHSSPKIITTRTRLVRPFLLEGQVTYDEQKDGTLNGWILSQSTDNYSPVDFQATKYNYPTVANLLSPTDALAKVKASAGASKSRDHVDDYLINTELASLGKKGALISDPTASPMNGPGPISGGTVRSRIVISSMFIDHAD